MQVSYKPVGGSQFTPLFNEAAGDALEKFSGVFAGILQREPLAGSAAQARFARGNTVGKVEFKWTSTYPDAPTAQAAIATIDALKLTPMHLKLEEPPQTATPQFLPNALSENYEFDRQGCSVTHTLRFESDDLTNNEPA